MHPRLINTRQFKVIAHAMVSGPPLRCTGSGADTQVCRQNPILISTVISQLSLQLRLCTPTVQSIHKRTELGKKAAKAGGVEWHNQRNLNSQIQNMEERLCMGISLQLLTDSLTTGDGCRLKKRRLEPSNVHYPAPPGGTTCLIDLRIDS